MKTIKFLLFINMFVGLTIGYGQETQYPTIRVDFEDMTWHYKGSGQEIRVTMPIALDQDVNIISAHMYVAPNEVRSIPENLKVSSRVGNEQDFKGESWDKFSLRPVQKSPDLAINLQKIIEEKKSWKDGDEAEFIFSGFEAKPISSALKNTSTHSYMEIAYTYNKIEKEPTPMLIVYPNPTYGSFTSSLQAGEIIKQCVIYDLSGEVLQNKEYENKTDKITVDVNALVRGLYIIKLFDDSGEEYSTMFIKN